MTALPPGTSLRMVTSGRARREHQPVQSSREVVAPQPAQEPGPAVTHLRAPVVTQARLAGLGHALPAERWSQPEIAERLASAWKLDGAERERWWRIIDGSQIAHRFGVLPIEPTLDLSTAQRMALFAREAPSMADRASRAALDNAGIDPREVTDVIIVTCTGFSAPGVDVELIDRLGLSPSVRRAQLGFMGCFGAISGLRAAAGACSADPHGVALVVCVELCTLHLRNETSGENLVATALFGDGAAAAVVVGGERDAQRDAAPLRRIGLGRPRLLATGRKAMTWTVTDQGFAMTLSREVPVELRRGIAEIVRDVGGAPSSRFAIHPGGAGILAAVDVGLELDGRYGIEHAWGVLRDVGNISSGSVLLVLERLLAEGAPSPVTLLAFGPGLTVETLTLDSPGA